MTNLENNTTLLAGNHSDGCEVWPVFICYRREDGRAAAEAIEKSISNLHFPHPDFVEGLENEFNSVRLDVYLDVHNGADPDYQAKINTYIDSSKAFIVVCTPGLRTRFEQDAAYDEIQRWLSNSSSKDTSPILVTESKVDQTKWIPEPISTRWPKLNVVQLDLSEKNTSFAEKIRKTLIDKTTEKYESQLLEVSRKNRTLRFAILGVTVLLLLSVMLGAFLYSSTNNLQKTTSSLVVPKAKFLLENALVDRALLELINASFSFEDDSIPDDILGTIVDASIRANAESIFKVPAGIEVFQTDLGLIYFHKGEVFSILDQSGPKKIGNFHSKPVAISDYEKTIVLFDKDSKVYLLKSGGSFAEIELNSVLPKETLSIEGNYGPESEYPIAKIGIGSLFKDYNSRIFSVIDFTEKSDVFSRVTYSLDLDENCSFDDLSDNIKEYIKGIVSYQEHGCRTVEGWLVYGSQVGGSGGSSINNHLIKDGEFPTCIVDSVRGFSDYAFSEYHNSLFGIQADFKTLTIKDLSRAPKENEEGSRDLNCLYPWNSDTQINQITLPAPVSVASLSIDDDGILLVSLYLPDLNEIRVLRLGEKGQISPQKHPVAKSSDTVEGEDMSSSPLDSLCGSDLYLAGDYYTLDQETSLNVKFDYEKNNDLWLELRRGSATIRRYFSNEEQNYSHPHCVVGSPDGTTIGLSWGERFELYSVDKILSENSWSISPEKSIKLTNISTGRKINLISNKGDFVFVESGSVYVGNYNSDQHVQKEIFVVEDRISRAELSSDFKYLLIKTWTPYRDVGFLLIDIETGSVRRAFGPKYKTLDINFINSRTLEILGDDFLGFNVSWKILSGNETLRLAYRSLSQHCKIEFRKPVENSACWTR